MRRTWTSLLVATVLGYLALAVDAGAQIRTPNDHIPNFAANPTKSSAVNGPWSSPSTWSPAGVPGSNDRVRITHTVTYASMTGDADVIGIEAGGTLRFSTTESTRLRVATLLVLANGALEVGTATTPIPASLTAEIVIKNKPLNLSVDPDQYGTGLLAVDGRVTLYGAAKTPSFVRVAAEPWAGETVIQLERTVAGWRPGDRLFIPDSRQVDTDNWFNPNYVLQTEEVTVQGVAADGRSVTVTPALVYTHRGARDADGTPTVLTDGTKLLPHVGNLTRNVVIRSDDPSGTRGHTLFTNRSDVDIRYVQFQDLGRTRAAPLDPASNHIGRYPLHIHHLWGPANPSNTGYQFQLVGNAIHDSLKWPIAVHGSHYGLVKGNVVFGGAELTGAGIAVENGSETENLFEENFVAHIRGNINPRESGPSTDAGTTPGSAAECFWAAGFNNRFVNNVAAACRNPTQQIVSGPCWKMIVPAAPYTDRNPRFRGADMTNPAETVVVTPQHQPILEFRGNECYGLAADGLTAWELGTDGYQVPTGIAESLVRDFRVWHTYEGAVYNYPAHRMTLDGLVYRIDPAATLYWPSAFQCGDYRNVDLTLRGGSIHAGSVFAGCVDPLGTFRMENVEAVTRYHAFVFETPATPGTGADRPPSGVTMLLRNNRVQAWPGQPLRTVEMAYNTSRGNTQLFDTYAVFVYDYQGQPGNDFRVYWREQATQNIAGGVAPCTNTATHPEIDGITCAMSGEPPIVPAAPSNLVVAP
jgi:hypothetical protein